MMSRPCSFMFNKMKYQRYKLFQGVDRVNDGYGSSMYIEYGKIIVFIREFIVNYCHEFS